MGGHHHPVTGSCATYFVGIPLLVFWLNGLLVGAANSFHEKAGVSQDSFFFFFSFSSCGS